MAVTRQDFEDAIAAYWGVKQSQNELSRIRDKVGAGTAGAVRAGKHFDPIVALLSKFFLEAGYEPGDIRISNRQELALPGYFRPQKNWDLVVVHGQTLVAAFELKALGAPSYGNNYNNRVEEALGSATDLRRAAMDKLIPGEKPWLGYFFVMEDAPRSRIPVVSRKGPFPVDKIWHRTTYMQRAQIFCERLLEERIYDAVCYVTSSPDNPTPSEPAIGLDWKHLCAAITARITYLRELGIPHGGEATLV